MKKLFVWLASVSICAAQAVSIGPFATEGWVEERLQVLTNDFATVPYVDDLVSDVEDKIPDVSGLSTKEYVDAVSNAIPDVSGLATVEQVVAVSNLLPDTALFATREWVGHEITNAVDDLLDGDGYIMTNLVRGSSLADKSITGDKLANNAVNGAIIANLSVSTGKLTNKAVTTSKLADNAVTKDKIDGSVTNWLATTNWVLDIVSSATPGNYSEVSNRAMQAVISESDPVFTNWIVDPAVNYISITNQDRLAIKWRKYYDGSSWYDMGYEYYLPTNSVEGPWVLARTNDIPAAPVLDEYAKISVFHDASGDHYIVSNATESLRPVTWMYDGNGKPKVSYIGSMDTYGFYEYPVVGDIGPTAASGYALRLKYNQYEIFPVGFYTDKNGMWFYAGTNKEAHAYCMDSMFQGDKTNSFENMWFNVHNGKGRFSFEQDGYFWCRSTGGSPVGYGGMRLIDSENRSLSFSTNAVLKAGTVATVEDLAGFANKAYVDDHQWDWSTQITNTPAFVQGSFDENNIPKISFSDGTVSTNISLDVDHFVKWRHDYMSDPVVVVKGQDYSISRMVTGYSASDGYSEPTLYFNKDGRTYTVPTNWVEGSYISSANGSYFNHSVPELRFKDGSGYTAYPLIGNYDKDRSYNRGNGISLVAAVTQYNQYSGQTEVTNGYQLSIYPEAYTYFYKDSMSGDLHLMNSMYAPGTYSYQYVNLTHPEVDYLRITNSLGYAFTVRIPSGWGYDEYPYYLPTNYVDGPWVLARTNDIPAFINSALSSDYVAKYWPYDSMAHSATTLRLGSKEYPMNRLVSGYNTRYNYPSSYNEVTLTFSDYYAIDGEDSSQYPSYTWRFDPDEIAKIQHGSGGYGPSSYYLYRGSYEIYDLFNPRPSSVVFTNANSVYDFVKYTHGYSSAYFKLPTDNLPYSGSGTYTIAVEDNRVPVFVGTDSASDPTILSNRSTGATYDMRRVAMFNDSMNYGILTNPYGHKSWDLDDMVTEEIDPKWTQFKQDANINLHTNGQSRYVSTTVGLNISDVGTGSSVQSSLAVGDSKVSSFMSLGAGYGIISNASFCVGLGAHYRVTNSASFVWTGAGHEDFGYSYGSHGVGTFNVDPVGGTEGFYIGKTNLATYMQSAVVGHTHSNLVNGSTQVLANTNGTASIRVTTSRNVQKTAVKKASNVYGVSTCYIEFTSPAYTFDEMVAGVTGLIPVKYFVGNPVTGGSAWDSGTADIELQGGGVYLFKNCNPDSGTENAFVSDTTVVWFDGQNTLVDFMGLRSSGSQSITVSGPTTFTTQQTTVPVVEVSSKTIATEDDTKLEPVYGDWVLDPSTYNGQTLSISNTVLEGQAYAYVIAGGQIVGGWPVTDDTYIVFPGSGSTGSTGWSGYDDLIACRSKSYRLGTQGGQNSDKLLAPATLSASSIAPIWSYTHSYTNGDFVIYNTHLYECTNMTSGAWAPANWKKTSVGEMMGNLRRILDAINGEAL